MPLRLLTWRAHKAECVAMAAVCRRRCEDVVDRRDHGTGRTPRCAHAALRYHGHAVDLRAWKQSRDDLRRQRLWRARPLLEVALNICKGAQVGVGVHPPKGLVRRRSEVAVEDDAVEAIEALPYGGETCRRLLRTRHGRARRPAVAVDRSGGRARRRRC